MTASTWVFTDRIENIGFRTSPLMIPYHMNFGFLSIDSGTKLDLFEHRPLLFLECAKARDSDYDAFSQSRKSNSASTPTT